MLYEWACEGNSRLARWFIQADHGAVQLHPPEHDLRDRRCTSRLVWQIVDMWLNGFNVIIWVALPCTAWSRWQSINIKTSPRVKEHIDDWQDESIKMVEEFTWTVERLRQEGVQPEVAVEWPRDAAGWERPE
eukprot:15495673-Heterocapsa_arctica.AAC.1